MKKALKITRRCVTLIEMMIVMFLIAMIIGVVGYNYQGSLEKGKSFKSKQGIAKLEAALMLHIAEAPNASISDWEEWLKTSPLVKNPNELINDGWGQKYNVSFDNGQLRISDSKNNTN